MPRPWLRYEISGGWNEAQAHIKLVVWYRKAFHDVQDSTHLASFFMYTLLPLLVLQVLL